jgi:hypothetical protein
MAVAMRPTTSGSTGRSSNVSLTKVLLACGVVSSVLYVVANDVLAAARYEGYNRISDPISALSAVGAPSGPFLLPFIVAYDVLLVAFGAGVWRAAHGRRALRAAGGFVAGVGALGLVGFPFPMVPGGLAENVVHSLLMGVLTPLFTFLAVGFGAAAFGRRFRLYSVLTIVALLVGGAFTGIETARVAAGEPALWFGLAERILFGPFLLWVAVLAALLLRAEAERSHVPSA